VAASLDSPPAEPLPAAAGVAAAVLVLPRAGWAVAAVAAVAAVGSERPGLAGLIALAALACVLLVRRAPAAWSLPAAAPVLGLAGLAGAYPAIAGRAPRARTRAGLGAAGAVWALLAEPALARALVLGAPQPEPSWDTTAGRALQDAAWPLVTSGAVLLVALWALAALVLPWLVRGRSMVLDVAAAAIWAGALAGATAALTEQVAGPGSTAPGLLGGALLAAAVAVLLPRARRSHGIL
jgi:hypothetical protein